MDINYKYVREVSRCIIYIILAIFELGTLGLRFDTFFDFSPSKSMRGSARRIMPSTHSLPAKGGGISDQHNARESLNPRTH